MYAFWIWVVYAKETDYIYLGFTFFAHVVYNAHWYLHSDSCSNDSPTTFNIISALWWETFNFPFSCLGVWHMFTLSRSVPKDCPKPRKLNPCYVQNYKAFVFIIPALMVHILEAPAEPVIVDEALASPRRCNAMLVEYEAIKHIHLGIGKWNSRFMPLLRNTKCILFTKGYSLHPTVDLLCFRASSIGSSGGYLFWEIQIPSYSKRLLFVSCSGIFHLWWNLETHFPN